MRLLSFSNLKKTISPQLILLGEGILHSYSQLFFSDNRWFALLLMASTFVDPNAGMSGLVALIIALGTAQLMNMPTSGIRYGVYGYNSLLVGLVMGSWYSYSLHFWLLLGLISLFTLLLSVWINALLVKQRLPLLGLPFLIGTWTLMLAVRQFNSILVSDRGVFIFNELYATGGIHLVKLVETLREFPLPIFLEVFLKSLGAIFFQYNILSGALIAIGILIYSRIAFLLSILGFFTGYFFYGWISNSMGEIHYSFIGFNFILSAIAMGGFFIVPSIRSFLLVLFITPIMVILLSALSYIFLQWQLPLYSLPFNFTLLLILFVLKLQEKSGGLDLVQIQQFQPEKNLYRHRNELERFAHNTWVHVHLPFFGEWTISQDDEGKQTHLGDWKHAWDFVVKDAQNSTYRLSGTEVTHFYCYNLPVLSPAAGTVVEVLDGIEDNPIGGVNLEDNWGNAVVLYLAEGLYAKLTHFKMDTLKVKVGDFVKRGDILGNCGNSGRSPEPHIHFQLQSTPYIGSRTLPYPLAYYLRRKADGGLALHSFEFPKEGDKIMPVHTTRIIRDSLDWKPGQVWLWSVEDNLKKSNYTLRWEVTTDVYGRYCLWCATTQSTVWFINDGVQLYFTWYDGPRKGLLYAFYLTHYRVLQGYYPEVELKDTLPLNKASKDLLRYLHDATAPFTTWMKASYYFKFTSVDDKNNPRQLIYSTNTNTQVGNLKLSKWQGEFELNENQLHRITIKGPQFNQEATWIGE